jgi:hypothetical protein
VEVGNMDLMTVSKFLENIMMTGRNRVVDIILRRNEKDIHRSHGF